MLIKLRPYQQDIINQTIKSNKHTLIQIPTGGGKTVIAKEIISNLVARYNKQVLFVAPKIILMEQTAEVFKGLNPHIMHGTQKYEKTHKVLISTIQTGSRRDINPDVIIIDEIHYGFEGKMLEKLIKDKPDTRIIGLSATPYDKNGKQLKGFSLLLDKYDMKYMVDNDYLVDIKPYVLTKIKKLNDIQITAGDYNLKELGKIVCDNQTILEIVKSTVEYIIKYKKAIVFAVDINHAELLTKAYREEGFTAKALHSKLSKDDIKREIRLFKKGQTRILVSVLMLTTGFDVPDVDVAIIARPTKSQNLYKQMVGRVLRLAPNKTHSILLDCGNVIENLGKPLDPIKVVQTKEFVNNTPKCEECTSEDIKLKHANNKSFWECEDCGHIKYIKQGTYECKLCNRLYTHDAKFLNKNNKLWLECEDCLYPTLISEYTGSEKFIQVDNKKNQKSIVKILEKKKRKKEEQALKQKMQEPITYAEKQKIILEEMQEFEKIEILQVQNTKIKKINSDFERNLQLRLTSKLKSMNIELKRDKHEYIISVSFMKDIEIFKKRLFKNLEQYQIDIINTSFKIETFLKKLQKSIQ